MRIVVTGSNGFIGTWLCEELRSYGHWVVGVDREARSGSGVVILDLLKEGAAASVIKHARPDVVVHLAAQVGRLNGEADWRHTIETNAVMTTLVANATAAAGARLVYTSTSEVYGDQQHILCDEIKGPFDIPHNLYGLSKRWGEETARLYAPDKLTVVRPSMPYGPGVPPGRGRRAMDNMLWQANTGQDIPVHRGAARSWCWIGDVVRGYRLIVEKGAGGTFNLGRDDREVSMLDLAAMSCDLAGAPRDRIKVVDAPGRQTVVKRLATWRLREELGWEPEVELDVGMPQVYDWIKNFDENGEFIDGMAA